MKIVNLSAGDAAAAFIAGRVDAAAVWNPWVNQIELSGKGKALFTSKDIPGLIPDLLVAQEKSLAANRKDYLGMVRAWFDVVRFIKEKPDEAAKIMAKVVGLEPAEYKVFLPGTRFFGEKENLEAFGTASDSKSLLGLGAGDPQVPRRQQADRGQAGLCQGAGRFAGEGGDQALSARVSLAADAGRPGLWSIRAAMGRRLYWLFAIVGPDRAAGLLVGAVQRRAGREGVHAHARGRVEAGRACGPEDGLLKDASISIYRVTAGWLLSAVIALPLGMLIGTFRPVQALLEPLTDFIRYMPAVAFIPLVMLWVGIDEPSKIAIIFIGTFFQMVLMVAEDVRRVPQAQVEAAQTLGATRGEIIKLVLLPGAKPALLDTLRITMGWAWTYLVVAELVAANSGLGYAILKAQRFLQTDKIFAGIIIIGLIGLITDQLFRWLHRVAFPWMHRK